MDPKNYDEAKCQGHTSSIDVKISLCIRIHCPQENEIKKMETGIPAMFVLEYTLKHIKPWMQLGKNL
jgi:hypothetical protein